MSTIPLQSQKTVAMTFPAEGPVRVVADGVSPAKVHSRVAFALSGVK